MAASEQRIYQVSGEIKPQDWDIVVGLLGKFGLEVEPVDPTTNIRADNALPYRLASIKNRDQYIVEEHAVEFWPDYRKILAGGGHRVPKSIATTAFRNLSRPQPRNARYFLSDEGATEYAAELGITSIVPRSKVGFPQQVTTQGSFNLHSPAAIQVGSFLDFMQGANDIPREQRPRGLNAPELLFLGALAYHLHSSVETEAARKARCSPRPFEGGLGF